MTVQADHSIYRQFVQSVTEHAGQVAMVTDDEQLSWSQLASRVASLAGLLARRGVQPEERVAMLFGNEPEFVITWLALARLGAVSVPVNPALRGESLRVVLEDCGAQRIVSTQHHRSEIGEDLMLGGALELIEPSAAERDDAGAPSASVAASSPAAVLYTSGTTGKPKGVVLSHQSYLAAGHQMAGAIGITREDRIMICLPLFHANPQFYALMPSLITGASIALVPRFSASDFWDAAVRLRATGFTYVGTVLSILQGTEPVSEHALRFCTGGGAPAATWDVIEDQFGVAVHELYGMTETGGFATINARGARRRGTCGLPRTDMELAILDDHDVRLPPGAAGQIALRPREPGVLFDGYLGRPDVTLSKFGNLWFHTGDVGRMDADGYVTFIGRDENVIRRGGENIAPAQIETALLDHPSVTEAAVIGVDDEILGQEIQAIIVPPSGEEVDVWSVRDHISRDLPASAVPRYFQIAEGLPKTPTEKIRVDRLPHLEGPVIDTKTARDTADE